MSFSTTSRLGLRYANLDQSADFHVILDDLATDIDAKAVGFYPVDTFANRPAAGTGNMLFWATDKKQLYFDDGTVWRTIGVTNLVDTLNNRPAANAVPSGSGFFATDQIVDYITDGSSWIRKGKPAGDVSICLAATADTGHILLQGQAWPATTGIYADIYARFGNPANVPDFGGLAPVGYKSGDTSFGTLLATLGEKLHTLITGEIPAHNHPAGSGSSFQILTGAGGGNLYAGGSGGSAGGHAGLGEETTTAGTGGDGAHNNIQPSKVVNYQAKL